MVQEKLRVIIRCFAGLLVFGTLILAVGAFVEPRLPYLQLHRVLTPEELQDESKRAATLAVLKKARGNGWLFWSSVGFLVVSLSVVGLVAAGGIEPPSD